MAVRPYNVLELCAGVGGLGLGIHIAVPGARTVAYVEREAYAAATLVARMEAGDLAPAPIWSDLGTFDARAWRGAVDCVASGDPCQPNSVAGKRGGADDDRFLIDQVLRIVDECRPHRLFRENVTGNADGQLAALVPALERLGYRVAGGIFSAAEVGASHRRERLFVMADREGGAFGELRGAGKPGRGGHADGDGARVHSRRPMDDTLRGRHGDAVEPMQSGRNSSFDPSGHGSERVGNPAGAGLHAGSLVRADRGDEGRGPRDAEPQRRGGDVADASGARSQGGQFGGACDDDRHGTEAHGSVAELRGALLFAPGPTDPRWPAILERSPELAPAVAPRPPSPSSEPAVRRVADGLADRVDRLRALGNGVVSLAGAYAWASLDALHAEARRSDGAVRVRSAA